MESIAIISYTKSAGERYSKPFREILGEKIEISCYNMDSGIHGMILADLVVVSAPDMYRVARQHTPSDARLMIANLTFRKEDFNRINALPEGTKAIMANVEMSLSIQCVDQIYSYGARHVTLIPYAPYVDLKEKVDLAVTPGEAWVVPAGVPKIIEIGEREIDVATVVGVLMELNLTEYLETSAMKQYCESVMPLNCHYNLQYDEWLNVQEDRFVADREMGVISFTGDGRIKNYNRIAAKMLNIPLHERKIKNILDIFPQETIRRSVMEMKPMQKKKYTIHGKELYLHINIRDAYASKNVLNYMVLEYVRNIRPTGRQLVARGYVAKYNFDDIIGESPAIVNLKEVARLNAETESSILITGESGTGKELLAQSIHNASSRREHPFVGINCAAFTESLLESELFGYEEGAFTGAVRGGKKGIFEKAHTGTLFLDEIGEMPVHLQTKLLRVLQEKEVTRIGGDHVVDVDVRIIAATNQNLKKQMAEGKFRADLFYRLNVIPLHVPPLRQRRDDIPVLWKYLQEKLNADFALTAAARKQIYEYPWTGNVREMRNLVEYCRNLRKAEVDAADLQLILQDAQEERGVYPQTCEDRARRYVLESRFDMTSVLQVLTCLEEAEKRKENIGRRSIWQDVRVKEAGISEVKLREILHELENFRLICIARGRKGTEITEEGKELLKIYRGWASVGEGL